MDKEILIQYVDLMEEIKDLSIRINQTEKELEKLNRMTVGDTVKGGIGGIQTFKIEGRPVRAINKKVFLLERRQQMLQRKEEELLELTNKVYEYIETIEKSELRIMFRLYYIDRLTWFQVAMKMNKMFPQKRVKYTEDSCRKKNERFFEKF